MDFDVRRQIFCFGQTFEKKLKYNVKVNQIVMGLKKPLNESRRRFCKVF